MRGGSTALERAVRANPGIYIRLVLQKQLIEQTMIDIADTDPIGGFGPGVYLLHKIGAHGKRLHLAEARFDIQERHGLLLCNLRASTYFKPEQAKVRRTGMHDAGQGRMMGVVDLAPQMVHRLDGRHYPIAGIKLAKTEFRKTRLYYLNILTEFAMEVFRQAGIGFSREIFAATHCVQDAYIESAAIARLARPVVLVNAGPQKVNGATLAALANIGTYFTTEPVKRKTGTVVFDELQTVVADEQVGTLDPERNYLFFNGVADESMGTVRAAGRGEETARCVPTSVAYTMLEEGAATADAYTIAKYINLIDADRVRVAMQGVDVDPQAALPLPPERTQNSALQERLQRCLVELSLKEAILGCKPVSLTQFPQDLRGRGLSVLATRVLKTGRAMTKQLIACVKIEIDGEGLWVREVRKTPWSNERIANLSFVEAYPFLLDESKALRDNQLWIVDETTGKRLCVWSGTYIPKIILNDRYGGIEEALAFQVEQEDEQGRQTTFYSKSTRWNLLPYYISMLPPHLQSHGEKIGRLLPVQDCGAWVRVFVPPAEGIDGTGAALSAMRDVMVYEEGGQPIERNLLLEPLMQIYLHTMTHGILVGGGNSKMSLLEKFGRVALEN